jgi:hypothetical protein
MKWLFLRGRVPQDRSPGEIKWNSLEECDDMWEHLFAGMVHKEDMGKILYWGGHRRAYYRDNLLVEWIHSLKHYNGFKPDVIIARGGFREYDCLLWKYENAKKIYYGANHGCIPPKGIKYWGIMVDSERQAKLIESRKLRPLLFFKPAPPIFKPVDIQKKYDVCFVAIHPNDSRKNVRWVYKTCPKSLKVLQLGNAPRGIKVPKNFTIKKVRHAKVPRAMNKCHVLAAPYKSEDSGPRVITEALACNVRPFMLPETEYWRGLIGSHFTVEKIHYWDAIQRLLKKPPSVKTALDRYNDMLALADPSEHLRGSVLNQFE